MTKFFLAFSLIFASTIYARAQQVLFIANCTGDATHDTASFNGIKSIAGSTNDATIKIPYLLNPARRCKVNTLTLTANLTLDNTDGSGIFVVTGQTLTVAGPRVNPIGKTMFFNVAGGQGTLVTSGRGYDSAADATHPGLTTLGTGSNQAAAGNDARLSDNRAPLADAPLLLTRAYTGDGSLLVGKGVGLNSSGEAVLPGSTQSTGIVGVVVSGGTNTVTVATSGKVLAYVGGSPKVRGRYVISSGSGLLGESTAYPTSGQVVGRWLETGPSNYQYLQLFDAEVRVAASSSAVFNVKDYGAICDVDLSANTGTDDATAIAAARAAAETAGGGTLYFPGRCATSAQLVLTKPLTLTGAFKGAGLYATSAFSTSTAIVTYKPAAFPYNDGWIVDNMTIGSIKNQENSLNAGEWGCVGGFAGCSGGDAIYIDSSLAPGAGVLNVTVKNSWLLPTGGWGIHAGGGNTNGTPARSRFIDNLIYDGVWMPEAGDTVDFSRNTMLGRNKAFEVTSVAGATTFTIEKNNITQPGGLHFGGNTYKLIVRGNIIELYKYTVYGMVIGSVGSNGAVIDLDGGSTKHLSYATVEDNIISALDGAGFGFDNILLNGVRVNYSDKSWVGIKDRYVNPLTYKGITITANATKTQLPPQVFQDGAGSDYTDAGTDTRRMVSTDNGDPSGVKALGSMQIGDTIIYKTSAGGITAGAATSNYSITPSSSQTQLVNSAGGGFTVTIPVGSNFPAGKILTFVNIGGANNVTLTFSGGDVLIDGSTSAGSFTLASSSRVTVQFNGSTTWVVTGK